MSTTKDAVLAVLRAEKVKLWLPPYRQLPTQGGGVNRDALAKLAKSLREKIASSPDEEEIGNILLELQSHAVQKLKEKHSVVVKILATERHFAALSGGEGGATPFPSSWGEEVTVADGTAGNAKALRLSVVNVSPALTVDQFSTDVCRTLDAKSVRVIWRGKNLQASGEDTLLKLVSGSSKDKKKGELLCLVSGHGYVPREVAASAKSTAATDVSSETSTIDSIRRAAHTLQNSDGGSRFEITDQSGNLVPMRQEDAVAFLTALGLHRIGRSRMERREEMSLEASDGAGKGREGISSALVFLLEADAEWNNSPALEGWKGKVDNYGLLQLDIAWCFLLLESLDNLADAIRRLDVAERVLRKQVHANFVTLALAQAEAGNHIPPLCSIFVRLFLLQGVANKMQNCTATAAERLGWARLLCHRLRSSCPADRVESLCNAYYVDPSTAIAALRRSDGDPDAAANFIANDRDEERKTAKKRRRQHRIGKCANGTDFVNLDLAPTLSELLGYGDAMANMSNHDNEDDDAALERNLSTGAQIVIGLLRLADNDIERAFQMHNEVGAEQVLERVARLDEVSGRSRKRKPKKSERQTPAEHVVQDMDLTMLVSMGVEETRAREALRATGNVDSAVFWLSRDSDVDDTAAAATSGGDDEEWEDIEEENGSGNDSARRASNGDNSQGSTSDSDGSEVDDAYELLERELGNALGADSKQVLEREWLGVDLNDEWDLIQKYI